MVWKKCRMVAAVRTTVVLEPMAKDLPQAFPPTVSPAASADIESVIASSCMLGCIDHTRTAMGSRLIRQWIEKPLYNPLHIARRQQAVGALCDDIIARTALTDALKRVFDMERLIGRVAYGTANCRDLRALSAAISCLPVIKTQAALFGQAMLRELTGKIDLLEDIRALVEQAIVDEPPILLREGGMIRKGFNEEIDRLRDLASGGKGKIAEIEQAERERTGISKLKIGYNRVFGYYIEVSRSNAEAVPENYIRKQTLANSERYITEELKQLESTVLGAQERLTALEYEVFVSVRDQIAAEVHRVQKTAQAIAALDVLCALADVACDNNYVCPVVDFSDRIDIKDGRHPVVEKMLSDSLFIPNDTLLDSKENRVAIITGPNMAGKSTYMRQTALIVLMAQIGSFDRGTATRAVQKLEELGYIRRVGDPNDRRVVRLYVTEKARPVIEATLAARQRWNDILTRGMTSKQREAAKTLLVAMSQNAHQYVSNDSAPHGRAAHKQADQTGKEE